MPGRVEGHRLVQQARQLLDVTGLVLKSATGATGVTGSVDLRRQGAHAELLGLRITRRKTTLGYEPTKEAWQSLKRSLIKAHEAPYPARMADVVISGWLDAYGPALEGDVGGEILMKVRRMAVGLGYRECMPMGGMIAGA